MTKLASEIAINDKPQMPLKPMPIISIGAGGVLNDAHLPAYKIGRVCGLWNI